MQGTYIPPAPVRRGITSRDRDMSKYGISKDDRLALMMVIAHLQDTFTEMESERLADAVRSIDATIARLAEALDLADLALYGDYPDLVLVDERIRAALESVTINNGTN